MNDTPKHGDPLRLDYDSMKRNAGDAVNLEPSLALGERLDGHLVSGHVDGVGRVLRVEDAERSRLLVI